MRRSFTQWQPWAGIFLPPICAWAPTLALDWLLLWLGMRPVVAYLATFPIFVVGFLGGMVLQRHIIMASTRPYLQAYLAQLTPAPRQDADAH